MNDTEHTLQKRQTGIPGLDQATHGGLPRDSAVLVLGEAGAGKTVLCLQVLANAIGRDEGGVFVSFEESRGQVLRDAGSFRWGARLAGSDRLEIVDARPDASMETAGEFGLEGLLSAVAMYAERTRASWIVLDGIDQVLQRQSDLRTAIGQVRDINDWCERHEVTALLTAKASNDRRAPQHLEGVEFILPAAIVLSAQLLERRINRRFRIAKYRGTSHLVGEIALVLDDEGIHLPHGQYPAVHDEDASTERISSGVERLDEVLGGGLYRGSTALVSGLPGTAKTTLAAGFADAAATRGEKVLYLSFDELQGQVLRNLATIGIDLRHHVTAGRLRFLARHAWASLVDEHYIAILREIDDFAPDCFVVDPVSALIKAVSADSAFDTTERLLAEVRGRGVTTLLTSLTASDEPHGEATLSHVSTLADTWIALGYNVRGGERNRSLSVVKSRGSAHSNQVRELVLSESGIDLEDVFEYGTEVLMGTARLEKRSEVEAARQRLRHEAEQRQIDLQRRAEQARTEVDRARAEAERIEQELRLEQERHDETERLARAHSDDVHRRRNPLRYRGEGGTHDGGEGEP